VKGWRAGGHHPGRFYLNHRGAAPAHPCRAFLVATMFAATVAAQTAPPVGGAPTANQVGGSLPHIALADGQLVTITTTQRDAVVYLAKGNIPPNAAPDAFENVGAAPVTLHLAPGNYTIEIGGPTISDGHATFAVRDAPLRIEVRPGNATVKTFGGVLIALGASAVIAGIIVLITYTQKEGSFDKAAIAIPLLASGVGVGLGGVGLTVVGTTKIDVPRTAGIAPSNGGLSLPMGKAWVPGLRLEF
jgi:hypothetical protein